MLSLDTLGIFLLLLIGFAGGMTGTLSGAGVGVILIPLILALFSIQPSVLVGSVFPTYLAIVLVGLVTFSKQHLVDFKVGLVLSAPGVLGALLGIPISSRISFTEFKPILGALVISLATLVLIRDRRKKKSTMNLGGPRQSLPTKDSYSTNLVFGIPIVFGAGLLVSVFGLGAGVLVIPVLMTVVGLPSHIAIGTSRIMFLVIDAAALLFHLGVGSFDIDYAAILVMGGICGTYLATRIAFRIPSRLLATIVAITFIILGAYISIS